MSAHSGRNALILLDGYDVSGFLNDVEPSGDVGLEDSTVFGASVASKSYTPTLTDAKLTMKGFWDGTATTGISAILDSIFGSSTKSVATVFPIDSTVGNAAYFLKADEKSRKITSQVAGLVGIEAELQSSSGIDYGVSLHALAQETAGGNGTTVDNGASSSNGGSATLHVTAAGTTLTVSIYHSTDNFATDDTLLKSFAAASAIGAQRVTWTGTTNRYLRIEWTQTGNFTFAVAAHRG